MIVDDQVFLRAERLKDSFISIQEFEKAATLRDLIRVAKNAVEKLADAERRLNAAPCESQVHKNLKADILTLEIR